MSIWELALGGKSPIAITKEFIEKLFIHEEKKYKCETGDISIILHRTRNKELQIMTYTNKENKVLRIIPDNEAQEIIMK
jgi:hypothetical protein